MYKLIDQKTSRILAESQNFYFVKMAADIWVALGFMCRIEGTSQ